MLLGGGNLTYLGEPTAKELLLQQQSIVCTSHAGEQAQSVLDMHPLLLLPQPLSTFADRSSVAT